MSQVVVDVQDDPRGLIIRIVGNIDMTAAGVLGNRLMPVCARRPSLAVLDLAGVSFIGSLGLGALVSFHRAVTRSGGAVRVAAAQPRVWQVFEHARLQDLFEAFDTPEAALAAPVGQPG